MTGLSLVTAGSLLLFTMVPILHVRGKLSVQIIAFCARASTSDLPRHSLAVQDLYRRLIPLGQPQRQSRHCGGLCSRVPSCSSCSLWFSSHW